jgi:selenophosphate synthetase-related protein
MGGIIGTTLMLLETSGCGAVLDLDALPCPADVPLERWLISFPSYGFLLSVRPENAPFVLSHFRQRDLVCEAMGRVESGHKLRLRSHNETIDFWDLSQLSLTGFSSVQPGHAPVL